MCRMISSTRAFSSALAAATTAGGVARIARLTVPGAKRTAAQNRKSDLSAVSNRSCVPGGVFTGGAPDAERVQQARMRIGLDSGRRVARQRRAQIPEARHRDDPEPLRRERRAEV